MYVDVRQISNADLVNDDHLPFDATIRLCRDAWRRFFEAVPAPFEREAFVLKKLGIEYLRALRAGQVEVAIGVRRLGRTSLDLNVYCSQSDELTTLLMLTFVRVDAALGRSVPLDEPQRAALHIHRMPDAEHVRAAEGEASEDRAYRVPGISRAVHDEARENLEAGSFHTSMVAHRRDEMG